MTLRVDNFMLHSDGVSVNVEYETSESRVPAAGGVAKIRRNTMDKSVEFSYEELANATNNFSPDNKIGKGGFGDVYYAELRGEVSNHVSVLVDYMCPRRKASIFYLYKGDNN